MRKIALFSLLVAMLGLVKAQDRMQVADETVVTNHSVTIKGKSVPYSATTGTQPVWDKEGKAVAAVHYTYYLRSDVKNRAARPLVISFNGGPGSGSVWMHLAYTGPKILKVDDEEVDMQFQEHGYLL